MRRLAPRCRSSDRWRLALVATLIGATANGLRGGAVEFRGDAWARFESNVSNSDVPGERRADLFLGARAAAGKRGVIDRDWRWRAELGAAVEAAVRYWELGSVEGGAAAGIERKFGLGWQAPRLAADVDFALRGAGQSGASGIRLAPSIAFIWQAVERWGFSVRYSPGWFFADGGLFDSFAQEAGISTWFDVLPSTRLRLGYTFRHGDVVSYAVPPRPDLVAIATVRETTDLFGAPRTAYRFEADTHRLQLDLRQDVGAHVSLRVAYRWEITQRESLDYGNHVIEFGVLVSF